MTQVEITKGEFIGYARVSTADQELRLQTDALEKIGCLNIYSEKISAAKKERPQLDLAIKDLRPGDTLVVWRLDRLARNIRDFYARLDAIAEAGAAFKSLTENFDFSTASGKFILGILAQVAEFERQLTCERTKAGMAALRERGIVLGAERKLDDKMRAAIEAAVIADPYITIKTIAKRFKIATSTFNGNFKRGKRGIIAAAAKKNKSYHLRIKH